MQPVNIQRLSEILNLSISTVSKALGNSHEISTKTKEKVLLLAKELKYHPNPHASSLRKNKSKTIAVIIPAITNSFFTLAINGIESVARENNYHVLIYLTHDDTSKEIAFMEDLHNGRIDGMLISLSSTTNDFRHLEELEKQGLPVVFFDRVYENLNTASVTTDDYKSAYNATQHLIGQGCTRIAHLMISENLSIGNKRMNGYKDAIIHNKMLFDERLLIHCTNDVETNYKLLKKLLQSKNRPDGIFASVEQYAILCYEVCRDLNLNIPNDVKIISFSNLETASFLNPSLTTVVQPAFEIGKKSASLLIKALEKKSFQLKNENFVFKSTIVERDSTAKNQLSMAKAVF
jgi:LacI family transcriptional regulator